jgi:hypothetical protein
MACALAGLGLVGSGFECLGLARLGLSRFLWLAGLGLSRFLGLADLGLVHLGFARLKEL